MVNTANEELNCLYSSPNIYKVQVQEDALGRTFSTHGDEEEYVQGFGDKTRSKVTTRKTYTLVRG
jgi:hypothetical protein